jgi:hypothetical protein
MTDILKEIEREFKAFDELTADQQRDVMRAIWLCSEEGGRRVVYRDNGEEAYAYPGPGNAVCWGLNSGVTGYCIARGVQ